MSYDQLSASHALLRASNAHDTAENVAAAAAVYGGYYVCYPIIIKRLYFFVTTALVASSTAALVEFNQRPTPGSGSGEVLLGQLTLAHGTAAGTVVYKDISPVRLNPGDELSYEHVTTAVSTGTAAGAGFYGILYELAPEYVANTTDLSASA